MQTIQRFHHGREGEPIIVIDDFIADPERVIEDAEMLSYRRIGDHYPGVRALVPHHLVSQMLGGVGDLIRNTFQIDDTLDRFEAYYSLVTTPPADLQPIQRLPHFDGVEPGRLALLLFLGREERGGTAFYRHRDTGFETVTEGRLSTFNEALRADIDRHGPPTARYISGDTPIYERIARYEGCFNRALIYRGNTLHCADIPDDLTLSNDPRTGRLTVNIFLLTGNAR